MVRRPYQASSKRTVGPRVNENIVARKVRLIGVNGENFGIVTPAKAMEMAINIGLDTVEISPKAKPPVVKIMDLGKFKYDQQKREAEARKKQKTMEIKEIKFRPNTDTHDFDVKLRNIVKFLTKGDKCKITMRFRGREMVHQNLGFNLLQKVKVRVGAAGKVESAPKTEGRQMTMIIAPVK